MNKFDLAAATWDENPIHLERSQAIAVSLVETIQLNRQMKALEYGAGTGILSFMLADSLAEITMMDSSAGMVSVMEEKVRKSGKSNLKPVLADLEKETGNDTYDLIFNQMVLHHIADVESIFATFSGMLNPGGWLAIADLYSEDGSFHGEGFDGHFGFDPKVLAGQLARHGFTEIGIRQCYAVRRKQPDGSVLEYPVFLLTGRK